MRIPGRRHWRLRRMNRGLRRSDPHLAAMLAIFARLCAGEMIPSVEQAPSLGVRAWRGLARLAHVMAHMTAVCAGCAGRAFRCVAAACAGIRAAVSARHAPRAVREKYGREI